MSESEKRKLANATPFRWQKVFSSASFHHVRIQYVTIRKQRKSRHGKCVTCVAAVVSNIIINSAFTKYELFFLPEFWQAFDTLLHVIFFLVFWFTFTYYCRKFCCFSPPMSPNEVYEMLSAITCLVQAVCVRSIPWRSWIKTVERIDQNIEHTHTNHSGRKEE